MIKIEDIFNATNGGLDIILSYYPQATDCVNTNKPFCLRNEKTPSAHIKQFGNQWKVTDFGDDGHAKSAIDIVVAEEKIRLNEAIYLLADRYNIASTFINTTNKADIKKRPANENEPESHFAIEYKEKFTEFELSIFGKKVTQKHVDALNYKSVVWYSKTKKNDNGKLETTIVSSTDKYPIFVRVCGEFIKVYQPLNSEKKYRFFSSGTKPKDFVNGLIELEEDYKNFNIKEKAIWDSNPINEDKPYKEKKIEAAVICSGERDAVNVKSYGYCPIWLNSETATLQELAYKKITKYAEKVYNIPDIDKTGLKKAIELGRKYLDIHTVKLPEWLKNYNDLRGRPRKDLRDYLELRDEKHDFEDLLKLAMPYKFWEWVPSKLGMNLEVNTAYLLNFLNDAGFAKIEDPTTKKETLIKIDKNIICEVTNKNVRAYIIDFVKENTNDIRVINLVLNSKKTGLITMDDLNKVEIDFSDNESDRQFMFFSNKTLEVTGKQIIEYRPENCERYIWENKISPFKLDRVAPAFKINRDKDDFSIEILNKNSHYFRFLINASRVYWREELENRITNNETEDLKYFEDNHFSINGARLKESEIKEQEQNLINKIFTIGYLMHRYKSSSKTWAVWVMEDKISDDGVSSGGSGKSFMIRTLKNFKQMLTLGGRNKKLTDNPHIFENVTEFTDIILIDDADQFIDFNFFYDKITSDIDINGKHIKGKFIDYEKSPKIVFTSNFPCRDNDGSTSRRIINAVFSDWYHEATEENDYKATRKISDDFGYDICRINYSPKFWNEDINFIAECLQFYLSVADEQLKIEPPMKKIQERRNIQTMGTNFKEWAEVYFSKNGTNVDKKIVKSDAINDFMRDTNTKGWTTKKFTQALKAFCKNSDWVEVLNPKEFCNSQNRIIKNINDKTHEMLYIKTVGTPLKDDDLPF